MKWNKWLMTALIGIISLALIGLSLAKSGIMRSQAPQSDAPATITAVSKSQPAQSQNVTDDAQKIQRLRAIIPDSPKVVDRETVRIMHEAAQTKHPEAALLLIKSLAFNFDPLSQNEKRDQAMMIPAIQMLKEYYGESVAPLLYQEAVESSQKWYRDRIALAVQAILSEETVQNMNKQFLLSTDSNPNARDFAASVENKDLKIQFAASSDDKVLEQLDKKVESIRNKKG